MRCNFSIAQFQIFLDQNIVKNGNEIIHVAPKILEVLVVLCEHQGETVPKETLLHAVWGDVATTDMVLNKAISKIRKLFGDSAKKQEFIKTISKKGYMLTKPVVWFSNSHIEKSTKSESLKNSFLRRVLYIVLAVGLMLLVYLQMYGDKPSLTIAPLVTNITADRDIQSNPRYSTDGRYVVYSNITKLNDRRIVQVVMYSIEKDRKSILKTFDISFRGGVSYVFSLDDRTIAIRAQDRTSCRIFQFDLMDQSHGETAKCVKTPASNLDWSNDGKKLVYAEYSVDKKVSSLVLLDSDNLATRTVVGKTYSSFGYRSPRFSFDSSKIVVIKANGHFSSWEIGVLDVKSGSYEVVLQTERRINQVVWTSENTLAYVIENGSSPGIWEINLDTGVRMHRYLTDNVIRDLDFDKNNNEYVFSKQKKSYEIWQTKRLANGSLNTKEVELDGWKNITPRMSPDQNYLAYVSLATGAESVFVRDMLSNNEHKIFSGKDSKVTDLSWSRDGKDLLLTLVNDNKGELKILNYESGEQQSINISASITNGRWSADGKSVYWLEYGLEPNRIYKFNLSSKNKIKIYEGSERQFEIAGNDVVFVRLNLGMKRGSTIKQLRSTDTELEQITILNGSWLVGWSSSKEKLFYTLWEQSENNFTLFSYDIESKIHSKLYRLDPLIYRMTNQLDVSGDANLTLYVRANLIGSDIYRLRLINE